LATLVSESPQACLAIDTDGRVLAANAEAQRQVGLIEAGVHIWDTPALSALEQLHHEWAVLPVRDPVPSTTISTNDGANTRVALSELPSRAMHQGALVTIGDDPLPWLSAHDGKTGLLSRGALLQILEERPEPFTGGVIVWLEIDRLEAFRELHGPGVEERLITQVAAALTTHLPTGGIAARLAHDEFLMLLPGVAPPDAARMLDRQKPEIRAPLPAPTGPARGSVSAGVAGLTGWPSLDEALIRVSAAVTRAQTEGGDRYVIDTHGTH
jgi:GGDEF domain-containing protein